MGELWQHDSSIHRWWPGDAKQTLLLTVDDHQIDFLGPSWPIGPTQRRTVTLLPHPHRQSWVVSQPPKPPENRGSDVLAKFSLRLVSF